MTSTKVPVFSVTSFVSTFLYSVLVIVSLDHCDHSPKSPHLPSVIFSYSYWYFFSEITGLVGLVGLITGVSFFSQTPEALQ